MTPGVVIEARERAVVNRGSFAGNDRPCRCGLPRFAGDHAQTNDARGRAPRRDRETAMTHGMNSDQGSDMAEQTEQPAVRSVDEAKQQRDMPSAAPLYDTVESAAVKLGISADALRARCRRALREAPKGSTEVSLGGGITAFKFGRTWRFRFPHSS